MPRVRISRNDLSRAGRVVTNLPDQIGREQPFAVIFKNNGVSLGQTTADLSGDLGDLSRGRGAHLLPIHPNNLLVARDNPRFHDRPKLGVLDRIRGIDSLLGQKLAQLPAAAIRPDQANDRSVLNEFSKIARHIRRAAGVKALARDLDHRHGRLGRNPADFAPDKLVQHEISDDQDAFGLGSGQNLS